VRYAIEVAGTSSYVLVGDMDIPVNFTIEAWFRTSMPTKEQVILGKDSNTAGENQWRLGLSEGLLYFMMSDPNGAHGGLWTGFYELKSQAIVPANTWLHAAATKNGNLFTLYLNGVMQAAHTATTTLTHAGAAGLFFGGHTGTLTDYLVGAVDEVRLWSVPRSGSEILGAMDHVVSPSDPSFSNLAHYWQLDEGTGTMTVDLRGSVHGILSQATWITPGAPIVD
jgi:hypothetical protein